VGIVRHLAAVAAAFLAGAAVAAPAVAHDEQGRAIPRLSVSVDGGSGLERRVTVEALDADGGGPIRGATVVGVATMTRPHVMTNYFEPLVERAPGRYAGTVRFSMPARWTLELTIRGEDVRTATARTEIVVERQPERESAVAAVEVAVRVEHPFTRRDALSIAVLWAHALAGFGWIVSVLVMAVALGPWRLLSERAATAVRRLYVPWGALAHWALAVAVIATGIYNLVYVTPFALVWRPGELESLWAIPYGALYQGILLAKLALFALLVVLATLLLRRTLSAPPRRSASRCRRT
jgi:hypothetical protein